MPVLSDTQELFRSSVERHLSLAAGGKAGPAEQWTGLAELGAILATVPEAQGGLGGPAELVLVAEALGYAGSAVPYLSCGVMPGIVAAHWADARLEFEPLAMGETLVAAAPTFEGSAQDGGLTVTRTPDGLRLSGRVGHVVVGADRAQWLIAPAIREKSGDEIVLLLDAENLVDAVVVPTIADDAWSFFAFDDFALRDDAVLEGAAVDAYRLACDSALVGQCGELVGNMRRMFELTLDYLQTRQQFNQPLSEFQALRHRLAEMFAELDQAQAMLDVGIAALQLSCPIGRTRLASACKVRVGQAARYVGAQAIQLHGAIALTEEYALGAYYRRSLALRQLWGAEEAHARRMASLRAKLPASD